MARKMKPLADIAAKFVSRASSASDFYKSGIQAADNWQQNTVAAAENWNSGVQEAASSGRFARGVGKVSNDTWKNKAVTKGGANYGSGVRLSLNDYANGFAPYRAVIEGLALPPRGPKGSPENYARVQAVGEALHAAKLAS